jgi:excinuclease ABC subunit C
MAENGLARIALAAIAKGESRRAGELGDVVFRPGRKNPLNLKAGSPGAPLLQHVRDTAHRFVISRLRRHKRLAQLSSDLDKVPGVGPKTAKLLWEHFDSVQAMALARIEDLAALPGFGSKGRGSARKAAVSAQKRIAGFFVHIIPHCRTLSAVFSSAFFSQ